MTVRLLSADLIRRERARRLVRALMDDAERSDPRVAEALVPAETYAEGERADPR